jgi:exosortase H (IPTLxxWG-CTERM-specific)
LAAIRTSPFLRFALCFVLLAGLLFTLLNWVPSAWVESVNRFTAETTGLMMHLFGLSPTVKGTLLSAGGFSVKIIAECSAAFMAILFAAFVLSYPASPSHKARGLALGLPVLFLLNNLRIVLIVGAGIHWPRLFHAIHAYIGQIVMIFVVLLAVIVWLRSAADIDTRDRPAGFMIRLVVISSVLFPAWLPLAEGFVRGNLYLVQWVLNLFGLSYALPETLKLYPDTFNTFQLLAYAALVLATRTVSGRNRLKPLLVGLASLAAVHFLFRLSDVLFNEFHLRDAFRPFVALVILNQWGLPFLLWLLLMRDSLFARRGVFTCPICGRQKRGMLDHIRAKHPDQASGWQLTDGRLVNTPPR